MENLKGKRFIFTCVAIICASMVTVLLKYDGEIYLKLVGSLGLLFTAGQTITDTVKK